MPDRYEQPPTRPDRLEPPHRDEVASPAVPVAILAAVVLGMLLVGLLIAPRPESVGWPLAGALTSSAAGANVASREGLPGLTTSMPPTATKWTGTATWYCGRGAACTRGYGPSDLVAAIDRKDSPFRKGDRVTVHYRGKQVTVRIVDVCACGGARLIDLTTGAFRRLAPLGTGVIPVTLTAGGRVSTGARVTLPPTDTTP